MEVVSQILTERPGRTGKREYSIADLDTAITANSNERKHVLLYPGDYKAEWNNAVEIEIPINVSVTLLPGAIVEYSGNFRTQDYNYDGPPIEAEDGQGDLIHPLATGAANRYERPNFTGHVENITDLNLASEWAFKQEFERSLWSVRNQTTQNVVNVPHQGVIELRPQNKVETSISPITGVEEGAFIEIRHEEITTQVIGSGGSTTTQGNINNEDTSHVIQNLTVDDGHITAGDTVEVVSQLEGTSSFIELSDTKGDIEIDHGNVGTEVDPTQVVDIDEKSVSKIETDARGHVENVEFAENVNQVDAGLLLDGNDLGPGEREINHQPINIQGSPENSGATVVRSVRPFLPPSNVETGHIDEVEAVDLLEGNNVIIDASGGSIEISTVPRVETRAPNQGEGDNGDIWFVEENP